MMFLGLLLIALAGLGTVGAVFLLDGQEIEYFGFGVEPLTVFLAGVACTALAVLGFKLVGFGARREFRQRKEHRQLAKLSQKLEKVETSRDSDASPER